MHAPVRLNGAFFTVLHVQCFETYVVHILDTVLFSIVLGTCRTTVPDKDPDPLVIGHPESGSIIYL